jgi:hypothetical protein
VLPSRLILFGQTSFQQQKHTKSKSRAGGAAQVVQHLPSKDEALNSTPSTAKRKKLNKSGEATWGIKMKESGNTGDTRF